MPVWSIGPSTSNWQWNIVFAFEVSHNEFFLGENQDYSASELDVKCQKVKMGARGVAR